MKSSERDIGAFLIGELHERIWPTWRAEQQALEEARAALAEREHALARRVGRSANPPSSRNSTAARSW